MEKLQQLLDEGVIDEVFNQLKTGTEAEVWLVSHHGEPVAAKIYKAREFRNFKNDAGYKEGRQVRNTRTQRAMEKGSKFGREASEDAWKSMEADTMFTLHTAGVRVPKPVLFYEGVLLMEVIGDAEGRVAPRLVEAAIAREMAGPMYVLLRQEVIKMLAQDYIHGDLSEFNILLGAHGPVIIDFPQVVAAAKNSQSEKYFKRDVGNLLRFFASIDPSIKEKHASDADEIWREYVRRDISPGFVPSGRGGAPTYGRPQHPGGAQRHGQAPRVPGQGGGGPQGGNQPRGAGGPQGGNHQRGAGGPQGGAQQRSAGGPQGGNQQRGAGGAQAGIQQRGAGGGQGGVQQRGAGGAQGGNQQRGAGGAQGGNQQRGAGGPENDHHQLGAGGPQSEAQPRGAGGSQGGHKQQGASGPQGGSQQRGAGGPQSGHQQQGAGGPQTGNQPRGAGGSQGASQQGGGQRGGPRGNDASGRQQSWGGGGSRPSQGQRPGPTVERKGPEVVFRGAPPARTEAPAGGSEHQRRSSGPRRRPPRRF